MQCCAWFYFNEITYQLTNLLTNHLYIQYVSVLILQCQRWDIRYGISSMLVKGARIWSVIHWARFCSQFYEHEDRSDSKRTYPDSIWQARSCRDVNDDNLYCTHFTTVYEIKTEILWQRFAMIVTKIRSDNDFIYITRSLCKFVTWSDYYSCKRKYCKYLFSQNMDYELMKYL